MSYPHAVAGLKVPAHANEQKIPPAPVDGRLVYRVEDPYHWLPDLELDLTASPYGQRDSGQHTAPVHARADVGGLRFTFEAMPPGRWRIALREPNLGELTSTECEVRSGQTTEHLFRWRRHDLTRAIWVRLAPDRAVPWIAWRSDDRPIPALARLSIDGHAVRAGKYLGERTIAHGS